MVSSPSEPSQESIFRVLASTKDSVPCVMSHHSDCVTSVASLRDTGLEAAHESLAESSLNSSQSTMTSPGDGAPLPDDLIGRTIVGIPFDAPRPLTSLVLEQPETEGVRVLALNQTLFKVRLADNEGRRNTASMLVKKMYAWRGYKIAWHAKQQPNRITLVASHGSSPMATISIGFDSGEGLLVDDLYRDEVDSLRAEGGRICEFTKLAVDGAIRSKRVLATLFHIAYIYSYRMSGFTDLLIEVNPRHVRFYEQMLGFGQLGPERHNHRVDAPAVLMRVNLPRSVPKIRHFGGHPEQARVEKSLFPYFFSESEENGIMRRLSDLR